MTNEKGIMYYDYVNGVQYGLTLDVCKEKCALRDSAFFDYNATKLVVTYSEEFLRLFEEQFEGAPICTLAKNGSAEVGFCIWARLASCLSAMDRCLPGRVDIYNNNAVTDTGRLCELAADVVKLSELYSVWWKEMDTDNIQIMADSNPIIYAEVV